MGELPACKKSSFGEGQASYAGSSLWVRCSVGDLCQAMRAGWSPHHSNFKIEPEGNNGRLWGGRGR
jgi:hypothetical protein